MTTAQVPSHGSFHPCLFGSSQRSAKTRKRSQGGKLKRTRRQTLLQLIRLIRILQNERVQEAVTADFELDLLGFPIAFYARSYRYRTLLSVSPLPYIIPNEMVKLGKGGGKLIARQNTYTRHPSAGRSR